jgi:parallel beta-helix repeat protein
MPLRAIVLLALGAALAGPTLAGTAPAPAVMDAPPEIATDTVWDGTVEVRREVRVLTGATLLVQPGTRVRFSAGKSEAGEPLARLLVNGTLVAQGTAADPVVFTSASQTPQPGDWGGIVLHNANDRLSRLRHVRIEYAVAGLSGMHSTLLAEDTTFSGNVTGVQALQEFRAWFFQSRIVGNSVGLHFHQSSAAQVEACEITGNSGGGIACILNSSPKIRNSLIADNGARGVICIQGSSPLIDGNTIRGHRQGIFLELQARALIVRNAITGNETGIWGEKLVFPKVVGNVISGNGTGIYCNYSAYMQVNGNNIHDNARLGLAVGDNMSILMEKKIPFRHMGEFFFGKPPEDVLLPEKSLKLQPIPPGEEGVVDARGNWWGAAATTQMEQLGAEGNVAVIEDVHDKPDTFYEGAVYRRDRAAYSPWEKTALKDAGPPAVSYTGVRGRVVFGGKPVAGVRVHAYTDHTAAFRGEGYSYSAPTDRDGAFSLNLVAGAYFLVAKGPLPPFPQGEPAPGAFFGYYSGNPAQVSDGPFGTCDIEVVQRREAVAAAGGDPAKIRVEGTVLGPGGPVAGAALHLSGDANRQFPGPEFFGPPGEAAATTDAKGFFSVELPAGAYFLVASKRRRVDAAGPLQPGDLHGYYDGNPLSPAPGTRTTITVQVVEVPGRDTPAAAVPAGEAPAAIDPAVRKSK